MLSGLADRNILSVDWDPRQLRMVHATVRKRNVAVERVMAVAIEADVDTGDPAALGQLMRQALRQEGVRTRRVIVNLPRDQVVLNTLNLPRVNVSDTAAMVQHQIAKELPFPVSEAVVDFAMPPDDGGEGTQPVLVGAVRHEARTFYQEVCHHAGLKLERIGLRPYANAVAAMEMLKDRRPERVLIVDVGPTMTEIDVIWNGRLAFSRAASVRIPRSASGGSTTSIEAVRRTVDAAGTDQEAASPTGADLVYRAEESEESPLSAESAVNRLLVEVTRSIEAYRNNDPGATMDHVIIGGVTGLEDALSEAIEQRFSTTTEIFNPELCFGWKGSHEGGEAFGAALGLVLGRVTEGGQYFDFQHPKKPVSEAAVRLKRAPVMAVAVLLFAAAGVIGWVKMIKPEWDHLRATEQRAEDMRGKLKDVGDFEKMMRAVTSFEGSHIVWLDDLKELLGVLPDHKQVVVEQVVMGAQDARIDLGIRFKERELPETIRAAVEALRTADDRPRFDIDFRGQDESGKAPYKHTTDLKVEIVAKKKAATKGKTKR
ncbi:MAG: pilus assembly protein PilM [Planctomycetes bacterium]|nr:pilus assembly protein PilM [Planctomycetota bacterium]